MPIPVDYLCASELIHIVENADKNDIVILPTDMALYHNYREGYVADFRGNIHSFRVNLSDETNPYWVEAEFRKNVSGQGIKYCLVPKKPFPKSFEFNWRRLGCVQFSEGED